MNPFIVYAMPRSRTAWLARFLSYKGRTCIHDALGKVPDLQSLGEILKQPDTGICETGLAFAAKAMRKLVPDAKIVVVRRPLEDIEASLAKLDLTLSPQKARIEINRLEEISAIEGTLIVTFDELNTEAGCRKVFEHCLGIPFDREYWIYLRDKNIQVDMAESLSVERAHRHIIDNMKRESDWILGVPTIQEETWADFHRDALTLIAEHRGEVGSSDGRPFDPNYELGAKAYSLGMLQIITARLNNEMIGYLLFQYGPDLESKKLLTGQQGPFFVRKQYRGRTGLRLHEASRTALKNKGVRFLILRSGIRGVGQRQDALFKRLGAKEDGHMHTLDLGQS